MSYTPTPNAGSLTLYLGICGTGRARGGNTTLDTVSFGTVYNPVAGGFTSDDVGMPIAIVGGGPVDADMPPVYFVQGALFHTTIAAVVSATQVTLAAAPDTSIFNTGFATVILYRPCPFASDVANAPRGFHYSSSIAPGTNDTLDFSVLNSLGGALGTVNPYIARFGSVKLGQPVYLTRTDGSGTHDVFGGYVDTLTASSEAGVSPVYSWDCQCASWAGLAKRRVVPPAIPTSYVGVAGDVVFRKLVLTYLSNDGVAVSTSGTPGDITLAAPVGANIGQLLDQVVSLISTATTAWYWTADAWRTFILGQRGGINAPWNVSDGTDLFAGSTPYQQSIVTTHNQLANNVYVIGQNTLLNTLNATVQGNGTATTFNLPELVGAAPTITRNSSAQTVGVLGVDTGKDWYWSQSSAVLTQDSGGTVLAPTDSLLVSYTPEAAAVAQSPNVGSLQSLQAIEGTSANYDYSTSLAQPILPNDLLAFATAYQVEYGSPATTCQFYTLRPGLETGQLQTIALASAGIASGTFLIATVDMSIYDGMIVWHYTAFGGANIGNAITALTQFINRQQATLGLLTPTVPITAVGSAPIYQHAVGAGFGFSVAFPQPVTAGDLLVVAAVRNASLGNPPTVVDDQGNTYTQVIFGQTAGGFPNQVSILVAVASATGNNSVRCASAQWLSINALSGMNVSSPVDISGTSTGAAPTLTTTLPNDVVFTACVNPNTSPTATAPELVLDYEATGAQPGIATSYESQVSVGAFTSSLNVAATSYTQYSSVAFRIAPTAPPAQTTNVLANPQGTVTHSLGALTSGEPVIGHGGGDIAVGTKSGVTTEFASVATVGSTGQPVLWESTGDQGAGVVGQLVPSGGTTGQVLAKNSGTNYDTHWINTANNTHSESLTDGNSNFIFATGDIVTVVGVPN